MHNSEQKIEVKFSNRKEIVYQTRDEMYRFQNFSVPIPIYEIGFPWQILEVEN